MFEAWFEKVKNIIKKGKPGDNILSEEELQTWSDQNINIFRKYYDKNYEPLMAIIEFSSKS